MGIFKKINDIATPWELFLTSCVAWTLVDIPLEAAFPHPATNLEIAMDMLISAAVTFDLIRNGLRPSFIKNRALALGVAIAGSVPFVSLIAFVTGAAGPAAIYLQALRVAVLPGLIQTMVARSKKNIVPKRFKALVAFAVVGVAFNAMACIWLMIYPSQDDTITAYNKAMYWLVTTIATVGYGDITPSTNGGRIYTMGIMVMGAAIYGVLIASASRMMLASDRRREQQKERLESLQSFFDNYDVPNPLQSEVIGFCNHMWAQRVNEDERTILNDLPPALQAELQTYMNIKPISRVSLFRGVSFECLTETARNLEQVFIGPEEKIISKGQNGNEMFLIGHGSVNVHIGNQFITSLRTGACFGEMALTGDGIRTTDVTTTSYCVIFKLSKEKFDALTGKHSDLRENIAHIAKERNAKSGSSDGRSPLQKAG